MNKNNHLPANLPSMEQSFTVDQVGTITGKRWVGEFTCKLPNTKERCLIGKHQAFLNGEYAEYLDPGTLSIHKKVAYLRFTLIEYPKFWRDTDLGYEMMDHNVIEHIYGEVLEFERKWLKEVWGDDYEEKHGESEDLEPLEKAEDGDAGDKEKDEKAS